MSSCLNVHHYVKMVFTAACFTDCVLHNQLLHVKMRNKHYAII